MQPPSCVKVKPYESSATSSFIDVRSRNCVGYQLHESVEVRCIPRRYLASSESAVTTSDYLGRHLVHRDKPRELPTWEAETVKGNIYISQLKFGACHAVILSRPNLR